MNIIKSKIFLFWNIGKIAYEKQGVYQNVIEKLSDYCSYKYGDSILYTRENIHLMKRFYLNFPVFYKKLEDISWEQYCLLLLIPDKKERIFYFLISLLFESNYQETLDLVSNRYYSRI